MSAMRWWCSSHPSRQQSLSSALNTSTMHEKPWNLRLRWPAWKSAKAIDEDKVRYLPAETSEDDIVTVTEYELDPDGLQTASLDAAGSPHGKSDRMSNRE